MFEYVETADVVESLVPAITFKYEERFDCTEAFSFWSVRDLLHCSRLF
jgi:hypothetical protein